MAEAAKSTEKLPKGKGTRANWPLPENRNKMEAAAEGWKAAKKANPGLPTAGCVKARTSQRGPWASTWAARKP